MIFWLVPVVTLVAGVISHLTFLTIVRNQSSLFLDEQLKAEALVGSIIPSSFWRPLYLKVISSSEVVVVWNSYYLLISTAALNDLTPSELSFLLRSEKCHLNYVTQRILMWSAGALFLFWFFIFYWNYAGIRPPSQMYFAFVFYMVLISSIAHSVRKSADKWRSTADAETVNQIPTPQVAVIAVQKSFESVIVDSKQTPYQRSIARLEVIENAVRKRQPNH